MSKNKYYVVWRGRNPGIYGSWGECFRQVEGFAGARYKGFLTQEEAVEAFREDFEFSVRRKESFKDRMARLKTLDHQPVWESISVDAACEGNPGKMEYRGVRTLTGEEVFRQGPYEGGTNNIGEFLAIVHAISALKKIGSSLPVYSDSLTARKWVRDKKVNTKLVPTAKNRPIFQLVERALKWLQENEYNNPVLTWDTVHWGEIPADFGRK